MILMTKLFGAVTTIAVSATLVVAEPALIFDLGGKFDKSFNEAAFNGAQRWATETGLSFSEIELQSEAQREQALRRFAEAGSNPIVMAGFAFASALGDVAADYPNTKFAIIDMVVDAPNASAAEIGPVPILADQNWGPIQKHEIWSQMGRESMAWPETITK